MAEDKKNVLEVKNLHTYFYTDSGVVRSVDGVDFELKEGSTLGIVGESGSGKSVTSLSIMGLLTGTTGKIAEGQRHRPYQRGREAEDAGQQDLHDLPGADDQLEPGHEDRQAADGMYPAA